MRDPRSDVDFARHIIDFNLDDSATYASWSIPHAEAEALARRRLEPIPWPRKLAPKPRRVTGKHVEDSALPKAKCLVVTWTVVEACALADVLTPGRSTDEWYSYRHHYSNYLPKLRSGAPARKARRLGAFFPTRIGDKQVLCFKSELHMSQDGPKLPIRDLWKQIIEESSAKLVITTGTAGAIGASVKLGDVVVSRQVRFDCQKSFKRTAFHNMSFLSKGKIPTRYFETAVKRLIPVNPMQLPAGNGAASLLFRPTKQIPNDTVVTTDFFAFDTADNEYKLRGLGAAVEMGDAVLGLVCKEDLADNAPDWLAVRNASDLQIEGDLPPYEQKKKAAQIYERYGYWTSVGSAIAVWAVIAGT